MRSVLVLTAALALTAGRLLQAQADTSLVASGATIERVWTGGYFLEGPAAAPDGSLYFSDLAWNFRFRDTPTAVAAGTLRRYDPRTGTTTVVLSPSGMSNGIAFGPDGQMYVAHGADFGLRQISRIDPKTGLAYIAAARYRGRPFNAPNDLVVDSRGRVFFTDPRYLGDEPIEQPVQGVYRLDPDGSVHLIAADLGKPNGIALSPDERTLYVVSVGTSETDFPMADKLPTRSLLEAIAAYDLSPDGAATFRRLVVDFSARPDRPERNGPDGITTDRYGNIFATHAAWNAVVAFDPQGRELGRIPIPEGAANLEFGRGNEVDVLYLAAQTSLYRVRVKTRGWHLGTP
jgi:gluconolactonase